MTSHGMLNPEATTRNEKDGCAATVCRTICATAKTARSNLMLVLVFNLHSLLVRFLLRVQLVVVLVGCRGAGLAR